MRIAIVSGLLALAGVGLAIPVGRHWSEARLEGGAFWRKTKLGFWCAALTLCLAYANPMAQVAPHLMEAVGMKDVRFLLALRAYSPFSLFFLLLPALYALLYWRALRTWKNGIYEDLDRVHWDTAYTRAWGNDVIRSQAVHAGFFSFLKSSLETGRRNPDDADRRADDLRISGRPAPLRQALPPKASRHGSTYYVRHTRSHRFGRHAGGHSFARASFPASGGMPTGGGFSGASGHSRGAGAGRSFATSSGGSFHSGGAYRGGSSLARAASGGSGFRSGSGKSRGSGAGRSFGESTGFSSAARMGAAYNMGTRSGGGKSVGGKSSGGKSGASGKKGKGGGGAASIGAALMAVLRAILTFLLAVILVSVVLFAGYGTAWLVVNRQDDKRHFFRDLERMTLAHARKRF